MDAASLSYINDLSNQLCDLLSDIKSKNPLEQCKKKWSRLNSVTNDQETRDTFAIITCCTSQIYSPPEVYRQLLEYIMPQPTFDALTDSTEYACWNNIIYFLYKYCEGSEAKREEAANILETLFFNLDSINAPYIFALIAQINSPRLIGGLMMLSAHAYLHDFAIFYCAVNHRRDLLKAVMEKSDHISIDVAIILAAEYTDIFYKEIVPEYSCYIPRWMRLKNGEMRPLKNLIPHLFRSKAFSKHIRSMGFETDDMDVFISLGNILSPVGLKKISPYVPLPEELSFDGVLDIVHNIPLGYLCFCRPKASLTINKMYCNCSLNFGLEERCSYFETLQEFLIRLNDYDFYGYEPPELYITVYVLSQCALSYRKQDIENFLYMCRDQFLHIKTSDAKSDLNALYDFISIDDENIIRLLLELWDTLPYDKYYDKMIEFAVTNRCINSLHALDSKYRSKST